MFRFAAAAEVTVGQGLFVVEAMQMQNEVQAPKAGKITELKVTADQTTAIGHILSVGNSKICTPRNFNIDPTGKWILIANQDGGTVQAAEWSYGSRQLNGSTTAIVKPVCIKILAKP